MAEELIFFLIPTDSCPTKQNPLSNQFFRLWKLEKSEVEHVNKEQKIFISNHHNLHQENILLFNRIDAQNG